MPNLPEDAGLHRQSPVNLQCDPTRQLFSIPSVHSVWWALYINNCASKPSVFDISHSSDAPLGLIVDLVGWFLGLVTLSQGWEAWWGARVTLVSFFVAALHLLTIYSQPRHFSLLRVDIATTLLCHLLPLRFPSPLSLILPWMLTKGFSFTFKLLHHVQRQRFNFAHPGLRCNKILWSSNSVLDPPHQPHRNCISEVSDFNFLHSNNT